MWTGRIAWKAASDPAGADSKYEGLFTTAVDDTDAFEVMRAIPGWSDRADVNAVIEFEFNRALDLSRVTPSTITLMDASSSAVIPSNVLHLGDHILRLLPLIPLEPNARYMAAFSGALSDRKGGQASALRQTFTVGSRLATGSLHVLATVPRADSRDIDTTGEFRLMFDRAINPLTINSDTVRLFQDGTPLRLNFAFGGSGCEVVLSALVELRNSARVELMVSGVEDLSGNLVLPLTIPFLVRPTLRPFAEQRERGNDRNGRSGILAHRRVFDLLIGGK